MNRQIGIKYKVAKLIEFDSKFSMFTYYVLKRTSSAEKNIMHSFGKENSLSLFE